MWARGFRFSFTPLPGSFSPFPHGTVLYRSLRVFRVTGWSPLVPPGFHVSRRTLDPARLNRISPTGLSPSPAGFPKAIPLSYQSFVRSEPPDARIRVCPPAFSLAATMAIDLSFSSSPYLDVSVQAVPLHALCIGAWMAAVNAAGFPHSDTCGSTGMCPSPQLFAACRVLHRPLVPRHPPCALICLTLSADTLFSALAYAIALAQAVLFSFARMSLISWFIG